MITKEFVQAEIISSFLETEFTDPDKPILEQLQQFLDENPGISIISSALSDCTSGFFTQIRIRTMIIIYR